MTLKEFFSLKSNKYFWLNIAAMLLLAVAGAVAAFSWLDSYTRHGKSVEVPDIQGMPLNEAAIILGSSRLKYSVSDSSYIKGMPPGRVLQCIPAAGSRVKEGRTIYLTISSRQTPLVKVPDVIDNSSLREAEARLLAARFKIGPTEFVANAAQDWVIGVKYNGRSLERNEAVPEGATLVIVAGMGERSMSFANDSADAEMDDAGVWNETTELDESSWFK